jgi:PAS domain S-box-containing protein
MKNNTDFENDLLTLALWDSSTDSMRITDIKGNVIKVNKSYCELTGFKETELTGNHFKLVYNTNEGEKFSNQYNEFLLSGNNSSRAEKNVIFRNGKRHHLEVSYSLVKMVNEDFVLAVFRDITIFMQAVYEINDSKIKYENLYKMIRLMCDNSTDMIWAKDLNNKYLFANKAMCENLLNTIDTDEPVGKDDMFFAQRERDLHKDNPNWHTFGEICRDSDSIILKNRKPEQFDEYGNVKGKFLFLDVHKAPIFDENGNIIGVVGSGRDVTKERKIDEQLSQYQFELKRSEENYRNLVQSSHDVIIMLDPNGNFKFINKVAEELTGYKISDWIGKNFAALVHPEDLQIANDGLIDSLQGKQSSYVIRIFDSKGHTLHVDISTVPVFDDGIVTSIVSICRDVTLQKQAEEKLILSETTYRQLLNTVTEAVYILDEDGKFIDVNKTAENMYGYEREHFYGKTPEFLSAPVKNDFDKVAAYINDALNGIPRVFEFWGLKKDGTVFPKDVSLTAGNYFGKKVVIAVGRDITERKRIEENLLALEKQRSIIFKSLPVVVYSAPVNPDIDTFWISESIFDVTGYTREEYLSEHNFWKNRLHPDDVQKTIESFNNIATLKEISTEYRWKVKSGEYRWFLDKAVADRNNVDFYGVNIDITGRKKAELALTESEERFRSMVTNIDQLVIEFDELGNYINVWTEDDSLLVIKEKDRNGKKITEVINEDLAKQFMERIKCVISNGKPETYEYQLDVIGGKRWFSGRLNPVYNSENKIKTVSFIARDITARKKVEEEIILKKEELEKLNAEKDKFFSIIAHDLRSPFTGFLGFTEMMKNDLTTMSLSDLQDISFRLNKSANNLYSLLNNLLEWSMMQGGLTNFLPEDNNLNSIVSDCIKSEHHLLTQKEISLHTDIPENLSVFVDRKMAEFVFRNLLSNSIKFTPKKGSVNISALANEQNEVQICVCDSGIGMEKELIDNLFKLSAKVKRLGTDGEPSTGLGLILCKDFVEKNGGTIRVESEEGKGSKIYFTLKRTLSDNK